MLGLIYKDDQNVLEEKVVNGVPLLTYPLLERTNVVKHGFSTRIRGCQHRRLCDDEYQYYKR